MLPTTPVAVPNTQFRACTGEQRVQHVEGTKLHLSGWRACAALELTRACGSSAICLLLRSCPVCELAGLEEASGVALWLRCSTVWGRQVLASCAGCNTSFELVNTSTPAVSKKFSSGLLAN